MQAAPKRAPEPRGCPTCFLCIRLLAGGATRAYILAPYASNYVPPRDQAVRSGPVSLTLARGLQDETVDMMDVEILPPAAEDVLAAVQSLRAHDGYASMDLDFPADAGDQERHGSSFFVLDTNILISHLALLKATVQLAVALDPASRPILFVPQVVLAELDGLKVSTRETDHVDRGEGSASGRTRTSISALARAAIAWLLETLSSPGAAVVRGQKRSETLRLTPEARPSLGENNDSLVLDAALWCRQHLAPRRIALVTEDRNLRLRATVEGLETLVVEPREDAIGLLARLTAGSALGAQAPRRTTSRHAPPCLLPPSETKGTVEHELTDALVVPKPKNPSVACASSMHPPEPLPPRMDANDMEDTVDDAVNSSSTPSAMPPLHADLPPPPLIAVETVADVFYNLALLTSHFIALPIYRHVYEHLVRTRPDEEGVWTSTLQDWRHWHPETCIEQARRWWDDGDIEGLCRLGLACAYEMPASTVRVPVSPADRQAPAPIAHASCGATTARTSRWATSGDRARQQRSTVNNLHPVMTPDKPLSGRRRPPQLAHIRRDLALVQDLLGADPTTVVTWPPLRWEVLLETLGLLIVAVLGGTFKADVRSEVAVIIQQAVSDLRVCGIAITVEL